MEKLIITAAVNGGITPRSKNPTSGLNLTPGYLEETAWNHLQYSPEIASFNCGSVNHGDKPFSLPQAMLN